MGRLSIHKILFAFFCFSKSNDAAYCKNILFFTFDVWRLYQINRRLITQALSWTAGDCWRWRNPYGFSVVCLCHCYVLLYSFVQLLGTIFKIVQAHLVRAAEVKKAIEWIMSNLDGHYAADSVAAAIAHGALTSSENVINLSQVNNAKTKNEKSGTHMIFFRGVGGLILVKMLSEYIDMNAVLPALSSEVIHRVLEMLKFFNTRACQLVLGAGGMQVSGLKSITSKHLALASQVVSFVHAIIPEIRRILFLKVPETQKVLLLSKIERVSQIHTKLVQIMRERLLVHLRGLPQIIETWNRTDESVNTTQENDLKWQSIIQNLFPELLIVHLKIGILMWDDDEARDKIAGQSVEKQRKREKSRLGSRSCTRPV
ncbi:hypothetical protein LXL04_018514 [Taraxacum kok-saghyz]